MKEELLNLVNAERIDAVQFKNLVNGMNTVDIAEALETLGEERIIAFFRMLPKSLAADVFSYIDSDEQLMIIEALNDREIGEVINRLYTDDAVDFIEEAPANVVNRVLRNAHNKKRELINQLLQYPEGSGGSIMTTEYVELQEDLTVREAFDRIRATGLDRETIYTCYVMRRDRLLTGTVSAKTLMLSKPQDRIGDIMDRNLLFVQTMDDQEVIAGYFRKYGLLAMPVTDTEQRLVGIITVDDIVQVIEEENTEDFEKMAALTPSDEPYMKTSVFKLAGNRIIWLMILMLSATITGAIITGFEDALTVLPALMAFIPMLMDTGGNAGAQTSTLIIRGMALGEIGLKDILRALWKEIRIAWLCGLVLGGINFLRVYFFGGKNLILAGVVTGSLLVTISLAKTVGCILPMVAKKLRLDPAIMAAPMITTIVDAASLLVYFSISKRFFNI